MSISAMFVVNIAVSCGKPIEFMPHYCRAASSHWPLDWCSCDHWPLKTEIAASFFEFAMQSLRACKILLTLTPADICTAGERALSVGATRI